MILMDGELLEKILKNIFNGNAKIEDKDISHVI